MGHRRCRIRCNGDSKTGQRWVSRADSQTVGWSARSGEITHCQISRLNDARGHVTRQEGRWDRTSPDFGKRPRGLGDVASQNRSTACADERFGLGVSSGHWWNVGRRSAQRACGTMPAYLRFTCAGRQLWPSLDPPDIISAVLAVYCGRASIAVPFHGETAYNAALQREAVITAYEIAQGERTCQQYYHRWRNKEPKRPRTFLPFSVL